jgi:putative transposase
MQYDPEKHHRRSIRLQGYDYSQAGCYFITLCVQDRKHLFGEIRNGIMGLNEFGCIAWEEWYQSPIIRPNISLGAFIVMPNHLHGIIHIDTQKENTNEIGKFKSPSQTIGAIIRGYKGAITKRIKAILHSRRGELQFAPTEFDQESGSRTGELQFAPTEFAPTEFAPTEFAPTESIWQRNYYEHIIRDNKAYWNISNYIWNNPLKWEQDKFHSPKL